jgi:hypothetical protein
MDNETKDLIAATDDLLAKLPFNENKVKLGLALKVALPFAVAAFPPLAFATPFLAGLSSLLVAVGLMHDGVKKVRNSRKSK